MMNLQQLRNIRNKIISEKPALTVSMYNVDTAVKAATEKIL
jgi:hypothetical protein